MIFSHALSIPVAGQPQSATIVTGQSDTLSVTPSGGTTQYSYQWYIGTSGSGTAIGGATSNTLVVSPTINTNYWVLVTDSASGTPAASVDSNTATITVNPANPTPASWINSVYVHLLNRPADPGGLAYWTGVLNALGNTNAGRTQIVAAIEASPEYRFDEVNYLYFQYLRRSAFNDPGASYWANLLGNGTTVEQVAAQIAGSAEFIQGQTDGTIGSWLNIFYQDALHRTVDPGGLAAWSAAFAAGLSRVQIAGEIFTAGPLPGLPANEYRMDLVDQFYIQYLGRSAVPDPGSLYWAGQLQHGVSDQAVIAAILGNAEFYDKSA